MTEASARVCHRAPSRAELLLGRGADEDTARALVAHFTAAGHTVTTRRVLDHRGPESLDWIVLAALPLQAFLSGLGGEAVGDTYRSLKKLVGRLGSRRHAAEPDEDGARGRTGGSGEGDGGGEDGAVDGGAGSRGGGGGGADEGERRSGTVPLVLQDPRTGLRVVLEAGLPEQAYERLTRLDLSAFRLGPVHYDRAAGRWRSELDEAAR